MISHASVTQATVFSSFERVYIYGTHRTPYCIICESEGNMQLETEIGFLKFIDGHSMSLDV